MKIIWRLKNNTEIGKKYILYTVDSRYLDLAYLE